MRAPASFAAALALYVLTARAGEIVGATTIGCRFVDDERTYRQLQIDRDIVALEKHIQRGLRSGMCRRLPKGTSVTRIERASQWKAYVMIRPQGDPDGFWIHEDELASEAAPPRTYSKGQAGFEQWAYENLGADQIKLNSPQEVWIAQNPKRTTSASADADMAAAMFLQLNDAQHVSVVIFRNNQRVAEAAK